MNQAWEDTINNLLVVVENRVPSYLQQKDSIFEMT